jgi:predicted dehydrogenase
MRAGFVRDSVDEKKEIPVYADFYEMLSVAKPDCVLIATMDSSHHEYCVAALNAGCDVICEKPMTIDVEKTRAILEAEERNNRSIEVTFNARYHDYHEKIKELIMDGKIGKVLSVDFEWMLDRVHGADYFRRWHKWMKNGGGLLVTKATHHFDLVNWWIMQDPIKVYAYGSLDYYGPTRAERSVRCSECPHTGDCEFVMKGYDDANGSNEDMDWMRGMYFEPEAADGYMRDQCVFAECDIYDNISLSVLYSRGAILTYSLNAYMPYEGWRIAINGAKGRLEGSMVHRGIGEDRGFNTVDIYYPDKKMETHRVPAVKDVHGGSDAKMLTALFADRFGGDPLGRAAGSREGAMSLLIGVAANESIATGNPAYIDI